MSGKESGGAGRIYRRRGSPYWWVQLGHGGENVRMSTKTADKQAAKAFLKAKITESGTGALNPRAERLTFEKIMAALDRADALGKHGKAIAERERQKKAGEPLDTRALGAKGYNFVRLRHTAKTRLRECFALATVRSIPDIAERYIVQRRAEGYADSSIERDLDVLGKALRIAGAIQVAAKVREIIQNLEKSPARQGFLDDEQLEALCKHLPGPIEDVARFAYGSGWRKMEILGLRWDEVDIQEGAIRLPGARTKTGEPRYLPYGHSDALRDLIERRREVCDGIEQGRRQRGDITPVENVFTWEDGREIRDFRRRWHEARKAIGKPGLLLHDMRRSFARRMSNLGVGQKAIMLLGGWESSTTFSRYNITSPGDLEDAMRRGSTAAPPRLRATRKREDR